jgi:hypothetical protein
MLYVPNNKDDLCDKDFCNLAPNAGKGLGTRGCC